MTRSCEKCGAPMAETARFCTKCGTPTDTQSAPSPTPRSCTHCGSPLSAGAKFCTKCGTPAGASAAPPPTPAPAAVAKPSSGIAKYVVTFLVIVVVAIVAISAGAIYVAHRVKQKAAEMAANSHLFDNTRSPGAGSSSSATPGSPDDATDPTALLKDLGKLGDSAASSGAADPIRTPEGQAQSLANAALVSQAIYRNLGKSPSTIPSTEVPAGTGPITMPTPDSYQWTTNGVKVTWEQDNVRISSPHASSVYGQCSVLKPMARHNPPGAPTRATGDRAHDWALPYERTENGPEADLVVRTGDINNLGFGWPQGFDPFSGQSTPPHAYPWKASPSAVPGTDRIMLGTGFGQGSPAFDGYSHAASCSCPQGWAPCQHRVDTMPAPIQLAVGQLPSKINEVLLQIFVDDFQAAQFQSHFQVSLNGTRIPSMEVALNSLDQTGPIGKLLSFKLLPEYWPLLKSGEVKLLIDDPTTHIGDGYAMDFARILVNPHNFKYEVALAATVVDADRHTPIAGATVTAALQSATTDKSGKCQLSGLPAGLVVATAAAPGYDESSVPVDLPAGQNGTAEIPLHRHQEDTASLEKELAQTGSATLYGIHFDTDSAKLRADSMPTLNAVLGLINNHPGSHWSIAGHTDNEGNASHNQTLSENRAASVIAWLKEHGVDQNRLAPQGYGATRPVADNATANGRALNRRVEVSILK